MINPIYWGGIPPIHLCISGFYINEWKENVSGRNLVISIRFKGTKDCYIVNVKIVQNGSTWKYPLIEQTFYTILYTTRTKGNVVQINSNYYENISMYLNHKVKVGDRSPGQPEGSVFNSNYTEL